MPPAYEEDEGEETILLDKRRGRYPESDDLLEEAAAAAVNGLVDGAVLAVATIADAAHLEGTSTVIASKCPGGGAHVTGERSLRYGAAALRLGLSRRQVLFLCAPRSLCGVV